MSGGNDQPWREKSRADEQKLHTKAGQSGRGCNTSRSPILPGLCHVNAAATWDEGYCTLSGEVCGIRIERCNPSRKTWLNPQKSVWAIVPEKSVKADGGKGPAVAGNTACQESDVLKAVARERMSARG